ncbi:MAG: ISAs1 family transposase [Bifidobacteriaceae bacterium]|jgi:predicted transposase YbfD/YdcC|nr:ISAs1 family transposase [Bifidobacteriaceae bacterium]
MSSSCPIAVCPVDPARLSQLNLLEVFAQVPDPRARRGVRHPVAAVLAVSLAAVMSGARSFAAIGQWAAMASGEVAARLGVGERRPEASTIRRVLCALDAAWLEWVVGAWTYLRAKRVSGRTVISFDGKTVRGTRNSGATPPHLVSGLLHGIRVVVTQVKVADKSNEIPALRDLLSRLNLKDVLVIADAMHTLAVTAQAILDGGGHYLLTVKMNQPGLLAQCRRLPWKHVPTHAWTDRSKGRRVRRCVKVVDAAGWVDFPAAAQIAQLTRTRTVNGKRSAETVYLLCSLPAHQAAPEQIAQWIQHHWAIESTHWIRDVTMDEDRHTAHISAGPQVMATLRNLTISLFRLHHYDNIAAAQRACSWDPQRPPDIILTSRNETLP